jgi:hypothetical protein
MEERNSPHCIETQINIYIFWGGEKFTILYRNTNKMLGELKETLGGGERITTLCRNTNKNQKSPFIKP